MSETKTCPECGAEFAPAASPLGVCPACLLKLGASNPSWTATDAPAPEPAVATIATPARRRAGLASGVWIAAGVVALALAYLGLRSTGRGERPRLGTAQVIRFDLAPPEGTTLSDGDPFAISPDGGRIVVTARAPGGEPRLWLRSLQSMTWSELRGTERASLPFWSPDGRRVAFFAGRALKSVDTSNGLVLTICDAPAPGGGSWSVDNVIVFAAGGGLLFRVPASGGAAQAMEQAPAGAASSAWPHFLPDGRRFLYAASGRAGAPVEDVYVGDLDGRRWRIVAAAGAAAYAQGLLVVRRNGALVAAPFDAVRAVPTGDFVPIAGAERAGGGDGPGFSLSGGGVLVHARHGSTASVVTYMDRTGRAMAPLGEPADYAEFSLAPDGRSLAIARRDTDGSSSIWIADFERGMQSRLSAAGFEARSPLWSPDGQRLIVASARQNGAILTALDRYTAKETTVHQSNTPMRPLSWSPDGRLLLFAIRTAETGSDVWLLSFGGPAPQALLAGRFDETDARFSPDGRFVAYVSNESGRDEIYLRGFPEPEGRLQISADGGIRPRWRPDGRELFFVSPEGRLMGVDIRPGGSALAAGRPQTFLDLQGGMEYEIAPDGQRFLVKLPADTGRPERLQVVLNWPNELPLPRRP